jgi:hypothetical protein
MFSTPQVNIYSEDVVRSVAWVADPDNNPIELAQRRS